MNSALNSKWTKWTDSKTNHIPNRQHIQEQKDRITTSTQKVCSSTTTSNLQSTNTDKINLILFHSASQTVPHPAVKMIGVTHSDLHSTSILSESHKLIHSLPLSPLLSLHSTPCPLTHSSPF